MQEIWRPVEDRNLFLVIYMIIVGESYVWITVQLSVPISILPYALNVLIYCYSGVISYNEFLLHILNPPGSSKKHYTMLLARELP